MLKFIQESSYINYMLEISNTQVFDLDRALVASGNPMTVGNIDSTRGTLDSDYKRASKLGASSIGSGHDNFLSGILVTFDVKYPLYWSPEFQRYHFAQIVSSQSTMHRLTQTLNTQERPYNKYVDDRIITICNGYLQEYLKLVEGDVAEANQKIYEAYMRLRSNLPSGYEHSMTVTTNYLQIKTMYQQRKNHKLKEDWGAFIDWASKLPHFLELTGLI